jgi:hypothetical protein
VNTSTFQDWAGFSDQGYLNTTDTILARTSAGAGVEIAGSHILARRGSSGDYTANGNVVILPNGGWSGSNIAYCFLGDTNNFMSAQYGANVTLRAFNDMVIAAGASSTEIIRATTSGSQAAKFNGHILATFDNTFTLGGASNRFTTVYATTGSINTSDERAKLWIGIREDRRAVYARIARRIADELGWFQLLDAVADKGADGARWHFGARAQRVWAIFAAEGLCAPLAGEGRDQRPDPAWQGPPPPALLCFDEWPEETREQVTYSDKLVDDKGQPVVLARRTVVEKAAGNRFGFRTDQLALLIAWGLHQRLEALEAAA